LLRQGSNPASTSSRSTSSSRPTQCGLAEPVRRISVQPYLVRYEDLTSDPGGVTRGILDFLGQDHLPAYQVIAPKHRRQADQLNLD
jgi:hypothetical protein